MEFDSVREYVPGDEIRSIDWNVTARTGTPFVKTFCEERELTVILAVDISASGSFGSFRLSKMDTAVEVAAADPVGIGNFASPLSIKEASVEIPGLARHRPSRASLSPPCVPFTKNR